MTERQQNIGIASIVFALGLLAALPSILTAWDPPESDPIDWLDHRYSMRPDGWMMIQTGEFREAYDQAEHINSMILYPHGEMGDSDTASVIINLGQTKQRMDFRTAADARALIEFVLRNHPKSR